MNRKNLKKILDEIKEKCSNSNWDEDLSEPVSLKAIKSAQNLLSLIDDEFIKDDEFYPTIEPIHDGDLHITWGIEKKPEILIINISNNESVIFVWIKLNEKYEIIKSGYEIFSLSTKSEKYISKENLNKKIGEILNERNN